MNTKLCLSTDGATSTETSGAEQAFQCLWGGPRSESLSASPVVLLSNSGSLLLLRWAWQTFFPCSIFSNAPCHWRSETATTVPRKHFGSSKTTGSDEVSRNRKGSPETMGIPKGRTTPFWLEGVLASVLPRSPPLSSSQQSARLLFRHCLPSASLTCYWNRPSSAQGLAPPQSQIWVRVAYQHYIWSGAKAAPVSMKEDEEERLLMSSVVGTT